MINYDSVEQLAAALRRAETAHAIYEQTIGHRDEDWPAWYAAFMEKEQVEK